MVEVILKHGVNSGGWKTSRLEGKHTELSWMEEKRQKHSHTCTQTFALVLEALNQHFKDTRF